jgi:CRISPR/Cas system endoribonuclease Cas6 (RAMP superfamily)
VEIGKTKIVVNFITNFDFVKKIDILENNLYLVIYNDLFGEKNGKG